MDANEGRYHRRQLFLHAVGVFLLLATAVIVTIIILTLQQASNGPSTLRRSAVGFYRRAAVATDAQQCSEIGRDVLRENGSSVDAAIAAMLCSGVHSAHSAGIGGGFVMVVYDTPRGKAEKEMIAFDAREGAPASAVTYTFPVGQSEVTGGPSIAVPGEILGYYKAWQQFGRLPWRRLFQPTIDMCRNGFHVGKSLAERIEYKRDTILASPSLREVFLKEDGTGYSEGEVLLLPRLADTLDTIANDDGVESMYRGRLGREMVQDLNDLGANITITDLAKYYVRVYPALAMLLRSGDVIHTLLPPSSGALLGMMLRILEGFNLTSDGREIDVRHKLIETLKFGYAMRTYIGDEKYADISMALSNITSMEFADYLRSRIDINRTHDVDYYNPAFTSPPVDSGTSHLSILGPDGSAVSITSTINSLFGSRQIGSRTGILFNDEMNDFWWPGQLVSRTNITRPPFPINGIADGKRPLSAMCPAIIVDSRGNVTMVTGAAGGSLITAATTLVTAKKLWLGMTLAESVDQLRFYHQLVPNMITYDKGFSAEILDELKRQKGHDISSSYLQALTVVQAIYSSCGQTAADDIDVKCIEAVCDWRKKSGVPSGF